MKFISIEGLDGAGKSIQSELLEKYLVSAGYKVYKCHFPDYDAPTGRLIQEYLRGELKFINPYSSSVLYALDRAHWAETTDVSGYDYVITDRYIGSNIIHQMPLLPKAGWEDYVDWLFQLEFGRMGVLVPDIVIALTLDEETQKEHLSNRAVLDIIESDTERTVKSRESMQWAIAYLGWLDVKCAKGQSIEEVHKSVVNVLQSSGVIPKD